MNAEELAGWEDGYYGFPASPRVLHIEAYMRGHWGGCHDRGEHDERLDALVEKWRAEDVALKQTGANQ